MVTSASRKASSVSTIPPAERVLDRDEAVGDVPALHLREHAGDLPQVLELDGRAEVLDGGHVAEAAFRPEVPDADRLLEGETTRHQLAVNRFQRST
jgi:hypothetical protein